MPYANTFPANFTVNLKLSAIAIAYTNGDFIADLVLPRVPVDTPSFAYSIFNKTDLFTIPETKVGRTSDVNQVDWSATQGSATVEDHALEEIVPRRDQQIAQAYNSPLDPKALATEQVADLLALSRESRAAGLVFSPASYATANKATLAGQTQWSDFTNSDPLAAIIAAKDSMLYKPNQLVLGQDTWSVLRRHPKLVGASYKNNGVYGALTPEDVAGILDIDEIVIGQARANTQVKGQTGNLARLWGKHAALLYKAPVTLSTDAPSFGITAEWGVRLTGEYFDYRKGMRGSDIVRVGESVKEVVLATDLGFFFQNAVA